MLIIKKKRFEKQRQNGSFRTVEWSIKGKRQNAHEANAGQRLLPQEDAREAGRKRGSHHISVCRAADKTAGRGPGPAPLVPLLGNYRDHSLNGNENLDQKGRQERHLQKSWKVTFHRQDPRSHASSALPETAIQTHVRRCKVTRAKSLSKP